MSQKKCSKCGTGFECVALKAGNETPTCWCEELYLDMETLKTLKSQFDNCLCPACLKEYSLKEMNNLCS